MWDQEVIVMTMGVAINGLRKTKAWDRGTCVQLLGCLSGNLVYEKGVKRWAAGIPRSPTGVYEEGSQGQREG